ncbi:MAG: hypothetical protein R3C49_23245 [Planctomycetaceae bacterium]
MSIQRAEQLKREWTDQYVRVRRGVPELRRFEGLIGQVRTVNMNCRLLVQFDGPADIGWYDIDPKFMQTVPAPVQETSSADLKKSESERSTSQASVQQKTPPATAATNPLDAIRRQAASTSVSPALSAVDRIRQQSIARPAENPEADRSPTPKSVPQTSGILDQIRQAAKGAPQTDSSMPAAESPSGDTEPSQNASTPLMSAASASSQEASTRPSAPGTSDSTPPGALSPLQQIRQQALSKTSLSESSGENDQSTSPLVASDESESDECPIDQIRRQQYGNDSSQNSPTAQTDANLPNIAKDAGQGKSSEDDEDPIDRMRRMSTSSTLRPMSPDLAAAERQSGDSDSGQYEDPFQLVARQAGISDRSELNASGEPDSLFGRIQLQADAGSLTVESAGCTDSASDLSVAGTEDPVKVTFRGRKLPKKDDLKIVEGIGPKIEELFRGAGISTWRQLADADPEDLKEILDKAGSRFRVHNPATWPAQAAMAADGRWPELEEYQDHLQGGRESETP